MPPCAILEEGVSLPSPGAKAKTLRWRRVLEHFNARRRSLAERAHAEAQCISLPSLLLHRDHRSEVTVGAGEALFETADRLDLPETMADDDCDGIAHGVCNCVGWTGMRAIMSVRRSRQRSRRGGVARDGITALSMFSVRPLLAGCVSSQLSP